MRLLSCLCVLVLCALHAIVASAEQGGGATPRIALLIGNSAYPDAGAQLPTTIKDVRLFAEELRRGGFDVDLKENLAKEDMQRAIDAFTDKIRPGTAALIYFNGFGIQVARQSYLIPVNAQIWTEPEVRRDGISIDAVIAEMHRKGARLKFAILDASRRNPFERRFRTVAAGLAALDAPEGTLAMFATSPGKVVDDKAGDSSLFMGEFIKEMRAPNRNAEDVFGRVRLGVSHASNSEQIPWVSSTLIEEFFFGRQAPGRPPAAAPPPAPPPTSTLPPPSRPPAPPSGPGVAAAPPVPAPATPPRPANPPPSSSASLPAAPKAGDVFRDCADCGEMVVVPAGSFNMGAAGIDYEGPVHRVTIAKPFAIGRHEVMFAEWDACVADRGCRHSPDDRGWGRANRPVINVSWVDAKAFATWLTGKTGHVYRLPTEAEWEYAARAGTSSPFWWGAEAGTRRANCRECGSGGGPQTFAVRSFSPNAFGLYDTAGNAAEWVEDCWNDTYRGAPQNGSAWTAGQCRQRVLRGGSFDSQARYVRTPSRFRYDADVRYYANGFRIVRELQ